MSFVDSISSLCQYGVSSLDLSSEKSDLNKRCFRRLNSKFDQFIERDNASKVIDMSTESSNYNGFHRIGALSQYNACREGFVFSNGDKKWLQSCGDDDFVDDVECLFQSTVGIALDVFTAIEHHLKLEEGWFQRNLGPVECHSQWHLKRYQPDVAPPMARTADGATVLLPMHSDPSIISIVIHDREGSQEGAQGLEYLCGSNIWKEVERSGHSTVTVFCGSVLDRITGGLYPACKHRVALRPPFDKRVVATFFWRPSPHALLEVPPSPLLSHVKLSKILNFRQWNKRVSQRYERHVLKHKMKKEKKFLNTVHKDIDIHTDNRMEVKLQTEKEDKDKNINMNRMTDTTSTNMSTNDSVFWASDGSCLQLLGDELQGREMYLGGLLADDGMIYGIPGNARRVLRINPYNGTVDHIGPEFPGQYKWLRGVKAKDGQGRTCLYGLPCHASSVLKIVPETGEVTTIGNLGDGLWKYHGGVLSGGYIYAVPQFAECVLRIEVATDRVDTIGKSYFGKNKWYGCLLSKGKIFGIPQCASSVIVIDTVTQEVYTIGNFSEGGWKWHGAVKARNDCIYSLPAHANSVLKIDPNTMQVSEIGQGNFTTGRHRSDGKYKYLGGVMGKDGCIYGVPSDSDYVLRIDPKTDSCEEVGSSLHEETIVQNKWQNGFLAEDGTIYGIPLKAETVLCIRPTDHGDVNVSTIGGPFLGLNKWEGGVMGTDGACYCMPLNNKRVLRIAPSGSSPIHVKQHRYERIEQQRPVAVLRSSAHSATYSKSRKNQTAPKGLILPLSLQQESIFAFDINKYNLIDTVCRICHMINSGGEALCDITSTSAFSCLEDYKPPSSALFREVNSVQQRLTELVATDKSFLQVFELLVEEVCIPKLKESLLACDIEMPKNCEGRTKFFVQNPPTLRIQPGPSTLSVRPHSDAEYGHQPGEINYWIPLTSPLLTETTLWTESSAGIGDYHALHAQLGEIICFHGSTCRHFVPPNATRHTRVSLDFRIGIEGYYDSQWSMRGTISDHKRKIIEF